MTKDRKITNFLKKLLKEHTIISKNIENQNLSYLIYVLDRYSKPKNSHKTLMNAKSILLCIELNVLVTLDIFKKEAAENLVKMLLSDDLDNSYMAISAIKYGREERIKKYQEYTPDNTNYKQVVDNYAVFGLNSDLNYMEMTSTLIKKMI